MKREETELTLFWSDPGSDFTFVDPHHTSAWTMWPKLFSLFPVPAHFSIISEVMQRAESTTSYPITANCDILWYNTATRTPGLKMTQFNKIWDWQLNQFSCQIPQPWSDVCHITLIYCVFYILSSVWSHWYDDTDDVDDTLVRNSATSASDLVIVQSHNMRGGGG